MSNGPTTPDRDTRPIIPDLDPFWAGTTFADHHQQASRRWTQLPANVTRDGDDDHE